MLNMLLTGAEQGGFLEGKTVKILNRQHQGEDLRCLLLGNGGKLSHTMEGEERFPTLASPLSALSHSSPSASTLQMTSYLDS